MEHKDWLLRVCCVLIVTLYGRPNATNQFLFGIILLDVLLLSLSGCLHAWLAASNSLPLVQNNKLQPTSLLLSLEQLLSRIMFGSGSRANQGMVSGMQHLKDCLFRRQRG